MKKVLVTGGLGFIGWHLVKELLRNPDYRIYVIDNLHSNKYFSVPTERLKIFYGDIRDWSDLCKMGNTNIDIVFHLGAQSNVMGALTDVNYCYDTNVRGTQNVLRYAKERGAEKFIFTSSREVYGEPKQLPVKERTPYDPKNIYGITKMIAEYNCFAYNNLIPEVYIFRLSNVYGKGDEGRVIPLWLNNIKNKEDLIIYGKNKSFDFVHVSQVIKAITLSLEKRRMFNVMNVGSGKPVMLSELAREILKLTNSNSKIVWEEERKQEVNNYVADVTYMKLYLGDKFEEDPLFALEETVYG